MADALGRPRAAGRRLRFALAYAVLAAVLAAATGATLWAARRGGERSDAAARPAGPPFSSFRSANQGLERAQDIADWVTRGYLNGDGRPLVRGTAEAPTVQNNVALTAIAIRQAGSNGLASDRYAVVPAATDLVYRLCGAAAGCRLSGGAPTKARGALLRRESLELALLSLHEFPDIGSVVVYLPPRSDLKRSTVLFFQRQELQDRLQVPLRRTLPARGRLLAAARPVSRRDPVEHLTLAHEFAAEVRQLQTGFVLVLEPILGSG